MRIGGLQKLSLIDYPGRTSAVVFTSGCQLRCPFCHNKELVLPSCFREPILEEDVMAFLRSRKGLLEGVVITGGEPTLQNDLLDFMRAVKGLGFLVKLDTNGTRPGVIREVLAAGAVDFIAMDVKAPLSKYALLCGVSVDTDAIRDSLAMIKGSGLPHQMRTTMVPGLLGEDDLPALVELVSGAQHYALQNFKSGPNVIDPGLRERESFSEEFFARIRSRWEF